MLAYSIRVWHPDAQICLLTNEFIEDPLFNIVTTLPHGDTVSNSNWKLANDWQVYEASPYQETIKLEADMWCASPIEHLWEFYENHDVAISVGCRDFYDNIGISRYYRKIFDINNLPDVYNGITFWRNSPIAKEFFEVVRDIFENWSKYKTLLKNPDETATTDVVYALAAVILGEENVTLPVQYGPKMVHMKKHMIPIISDNWTNELVAEQIRGNIRINTVSQWGFVHYHVKDTVK
jgi:hypothetical protein